MTIEAGVSQSSMHSSSSSSALATCQNRMQAEASDQQPAADIQRSRCSC